MEIEDKNLKLINLLIRDKRTKSNGMICSLEISRYIGGFYLSYRALFDQHRYENVFIEDFEKGNVVFLIPFGVKYMVKEFTEMGERSKQAIKEFFGDKFREDMIMEISEEERQNQIREWEKFTNSLNEWNNLLTDCKAPL
ncbi:MAG: hypothetical protein NC131_01255 [Roseburia sp.]|nr:hypothetical protein [Roseburia sp.]